MYKLEPTKAFESGLKALSKREQRAVAAKLKIMAENPFHPSLRTKKVQRMKGVFECSVNMDIRILWMYEDARLLLLIDIGHHDIVDAL
jgi:mRNA-degrading endonuclease YafQ of YafQ-DinJ toxin-antitoxin module